MLGCLLLFNENTNLIFFNYLIKRKSINRQIPLQNYKYGNYSCNLKKGKNSCKIVKH